MARAEALAAHLGGVRRRLRSWLTRRPGLPVPELARLPRLPDDVARLPRFKPVVAPDVSIVVPVYDQPALSFRCLLALREAESEASFEVIVVDDGSGVETCQLLESVSGIRHLVQERNRGFVHACNRGAAAAEGRYLLFLNNDTAVTDGWLDELLATFDLFPDAGIVGAALLRFDGRLQEAGAVVWRDGSAANCGRGEHPDSPEFAYPRAVDYCSGACLMIPRRLFMDLGGFDEHFAPAYYEDVDLAFRAREEGRMAYVQPRARVFHEEGGTGGTDLAKGAKRHQAINREKFERRWRSVLRTHAEPGEGIHLEKDRYASKRVLIIDHRTPTPDQDAGSARLVAVLDELRAMRVKVTLLPADLTAVEPYAQDLLGRGVELVCAPYARSVRSYLKRNGAAYDLVILCRFQIAERYLASVRRWCPGTRVVLDTVDLHFLREQRAARVEGDAHAETRAESMKRRELEVADRCDVTLVASPAEQELLASEAPSLEVALLPTRYRTSDASPGFENRRDLFFVGGFEHPPNVDAVQWFAARVFPTIREALPGVRFCVVGSKPPAEVADLSHDGIEVLGHVPDLTPFLEGCRLSVAPLRYGAGMKGKVHQSLAAGLPCVTTSVGAEGLALTSGQNAMIADDEDSFAKATIRLYSDRELWQRVAAAGRRHVREHLGSDRFAAAVRALVADPAD